MSKRILNDRLSLYDSIGGSIGFWKNTEVSAYTGYKKDPLTGKTTWDECIFENAHNIVVIGGVQFAMEQLYGVKGPLTVPTLYSQLQIGLPDATYSSNTIQIPTGTRDLPNPYGMCSFLFGVGLSGSAENTITKYPIDYKEYTLQMNKTADDGANLDGIMIPFRYTTEALSSTDQKKYFGKKVESGYNAFYLKAFDAAPSINHYWKTASKIEEMTEVTNSEIWTTGKKTPIVSVTEVNIKIAEEDINEWFVVKGRVDEPRINTIGIYTGFYNKVSGDYENVRLFSKLYIPTENLSLSKEVHFVYRSYGS